MYGIDTRQFINTMKPGQTAINPGGTSGGGMSGAGYGMIASGVISSIGTIVEGYINAGRMKNQFDFQAKMLALKGRMVRLGADIEIKRIRSRAQTLYGMQRAGYANAGVKMSGSPAAVMLASLREAELDVIYTDINAEYAVETGDTQSAVYRAQGRMTGYEANINTGNTILSMGTNYAKAMALSSEN